MAQSSIFKPVAIVTFLSAMAVIMIDRRISVDIISDTIRELIPNRSAIAGVNNPAQVTETSRPAVRKKGNPKSGWNVTWAVGEWRTVTELPDKPQSLRLGLSRSELIQQLGAPMLRTTETQNRKVIERYIYVDSEQNTKTVVILENGRTVLGEANR